MLSPRPHGRYRLRDWLALPRRTRPLPRRSFRPAHRIGPRARAPALCSDLPSDLRVIIGRDNWLFLNGDGTIEQATGKLLREAEIAKFADRAAALHTRLAGKESPLSGRDPAERPDHQPRPSARLGRRQRRR